MPVKEHFRKLPTNNRPEMGDKLQLYVPVLVKTVATILMVEKDKP